MDAVIEDIIQFCMHAWIGIGIERIYIKHHHKNLISMRELGIIHESRQAIILVFFGNPILTNAIYTLIYIFRIPIQEYSKLLALHLLPGNDTIGIFHRRITDIDRGGNIIPQVAIGLKPIHSIAEVELDIATRGRFTPITFRKCTDTKLCGSIVCSIMVVAKHLPIRGPVRIIIPATDQITKRCPRLALYIP